MNQNSIFLLLMFLSLIGTGTVSAQDTTLRQLQVMAEFPGGMRAFGHYLLDSLQLHLNSEADIGSKLVISFTVTSQGYMDDIIIKKKTVPFFDADIIRILKSMPRWKPAMYGDSAVSSTLVIPLNICFQR